MEKLHQLLEKRVQSETMTEGYLSNEILDYLRRTKETKSEIEQLLSKDLTTWKAQIKETGVSYEKLMSDMKKIQTIREQTLQIFSGETV